MIASVTDIFLVASFTMFTTGFFAVILSPVRRWFKAIHEKFRLRHLFIGFLLCFALSLTIGWEDWKAGWNSDSCGSSGTSETEILP